MFYILESKEQIQLLRNLKNESVYLEVISSNDNYHPILTETVAIYIHPLSQENGYIVPISHPDGLNVDKDEIHSILRDYDSIYVINKKELFYHFILPNAIDISLLNSMNNYSKLELGTANMNYNWFYNKFSKYDDINKLIPIPKLFEKCESNYNQLKSIMKLPICNGFDFYNKTATNVFFLIEQSGLGIKYGQFLENHTPKDPRYNISNNVVYTNYNLNNATSRPTNAFNSINFAAIPKTDSHRKCIVPTNDVFVECDFDGYHIRLLCEQIGYELTDESAHTELARLYYDKEVISEDEYLQAKQTNFQALYGKIPSEYIHLDLFKKIRAYIYSMWVKFNEEGYVEDPISGRRFTNKLEDMHPQKLFNYFMQSLESSKNICILQEVLRYLKDKKTKVALYVYDSILFDFSKEDGKETLEELDRILSQGGKYPIKIKHGNSLNY